MPSPAHWIPLRAISPGPAAASARITHVDFIEKEEEGEEEYGGYLQPVYISSYDVMYIVAVSVGVFHSFGDSNV